MALSITPEQVGAYILGQPLLFDFLNAPDATNSRTALRRADLAQLRMACRWAPLGGIAAVLHPAPSVRRLIAHGMLMSTGTHLLPTEYGRQVCRYNASCRDGTEGAAQRA